MLSLGGVPSSYPPRGQDPASCPLSPAHFSKDYRTEAEVLFLLQIHSPVDTPMSRALPWITTGGRAAYRSLPMSYFLDARNVQLLTVNGRLSGQVIVNRFWYSYVAGLPNPDPDVSNLFLQSFITAFRAQILASFYQTYTVFSYELKEMNDAVLVSVGPPSKWRPSFNVDKVDTTLGVAGDVGALAPGASTLMPAHEAVRVFLKPTARLLGYRKGNYLRISAGFPDTIKDPADREKITAGAAATFDAAFGGFVATAIHGVAVPAGAGWFPVCMSVPYFGRVVKPAGGDPRQGGSKVISALTNRFIGTQVTRRWNPNGTFRGR